MRRLRRVKTTHEDDFEIGEPIPGTFRHVGHVGWDPEKGFDCSNIPPQWKALFKAAGIRKRDLQDPATRREVLQTIYDLTGASIDDDMPPLAPVSAAQLRLRQPSDSSTKAATTPSTVVSEGESTTFAAAADGDDSTKPVPPPVPRTRPIRNSTHVDAQATTTTTTVPLPAPLQDKENEAQAAKLELPLISGTEATT